MRTVNTKSRRVMPYGTSSKKIKELAMKDIAKEGICYVRREAEVLKLMKLDFEYIDIDNLKN